MKLKEKIKIITFISIILILLNVFITCFYGFEIKRIIFILLSILIIIYARTSKNLFPLSAIFGLMGIMENHPGMLIITGCGLFSSYMKSDEEKSLEDFIKMSPLFSSVILGISGISLVSYGALIIYCIQYKYGPEMLSELAACIGLGVIIYICHKYKFIIKNEVTFFEMIKISLPVWLFFLVSSTVQIGMNIYTHPLQSSTYIILLIINFLLVGLFEEFLIRGIVLNVLLDKYNNSRKEVWFAVVISSLLFGLAHFMNLSTGASLFGVTMQVISATAMGIYLASIYLRTRNIWYNSLIHGLWDICASLSFIFIGNEMDYGDVISGYSIVVLIPAFFYLTFALFLLRKKKIDGIIAKLNNREYMEKTRGGILAFQRFVSCIIILFVVFIVTGLVYDFKIIDNNVKSTLSNFPMYYDSEKKYIFTEEFKTGDLTLDLRLYMATYTLDLDKNKDFNFSDEELSKAYKKLFKKELKDNDYIDFEYSRNQMCTHIKNGYNCLYTNKNVERNIKVYYGIKNYNTDGSGVIMDIYYLVYDMDSNKIYSDSSLNNLIYTGDINRLTKEEYNENDIYNSKFFKDISKNIEIPIYKLKFSSNSLDGLVFKGVDKYTEKLNISLNYDTKMFQRKDYDKKIVLENNKNNYIEIKSISQSLYMDKVVNSSILYIGDNKYYYNSFDNIYLINNKKNYYYIYINVNDNSISDKAYDVLKNIDIIEK